MSAPASMTLPAVGSFELRRRQVVAVFKNELVRSFLGRRAVLLYLAALAPIGLAAVMSLVRVLFPGEESGPPGQGVAIFAGLYQTLMLRLVIFFGSLWAFINLFRGEVLDRSLHFHFLTPARREVIVLGKYLAGVVGTSVLFGLSTVITYLVIFLPGGMGALTDHLFAGPGLGQLATYLGITLLAVVGYGAVALLLGLFFTNSVFPALLLFGWETIEFLLPPVLKRLSVLNYLKSLLPVQLSDGPFAIVANPPPAWLAIGGLLLFSTALVAISCWRARNFEIRYGED